MQMYMTGRYYNCQNQEQTNAHQIAIQYNILWDEIMWEIWDISERPIFGLPFCGDLKS